ncbi:MAG: YkgJ family cysteine cluster protein [Thermacetogeniaceae bacterium]
MLSIDKVRFWWDEAEGCYDLELLDPEATVADYERASEQALTAQDVLRRYSESCIGCCICCGGRLPLTVVDVYRLKMGGLGAGLPLDSWVETYGSIERQNGGVDITLNLDGYETCALWDRGRGLCCVYESRPLICRTYICAPLSWRAMELRAQVVNAGEDELVSMLGIGNKDERPGRLPPFAGVLDYRAVMLLDVCSSRLWHYLTEHSGESGNFSRTDIEQNR